MYDPLIEIYLNSTRIRTQKFDKDSFTIGRSSKNDIAIDDLAMSRVHARLTKSKNGILLEDENSENGCFLNGLRIRRAIVHPEDEILLARYRLKLCATAEEPLVAAASTAPAPELREEMGTIFTPPKLSTPPDSKTILVLRTSPGGEKTFAWDKPEILIGRGSNCEISLFEAQVARRHARLLREGDRYIVEDLGSANGTRVNGKAISTHGLAPGDVIEIGTHEIVFRIEGDSRVASKVAPETAPAAAQPRPTLADTDVSISQVPADKNSAHDIDTQTTLNLDAEATLRSAEHALVADLRTPPPMRTAPAATQEVTLVTQTPPPLRPEAVETQVKLQAAKTPPALPGIAMDTNTTFVDTPTIPDALRVTPIDAILKASLEAPGAISSLFDTDATLTGVDSQGTIKTPSSPTPVLLAPPPLPKRPPLPTQPTPAATGMTQPLRPELAATQIKVRSPQALPSQDLALDVMIDLEALAPEVREALQKLCESGLELPARLRLRSK